MDINELFKRSDQLIAIRQQIWKEIKELQDQSDKKGPPNKKYLSSLQEQYDNFQAEITTINIEINRLQRNRSSARYNKIS